MPVWERGFDPYVFGEDAEVFYTDGGIAGMQTFNMGAIEVTIDDDHVRLRSPVIGRDVAIDKADVLAVYRGSLTGVRFVPKSADFGIDTYRVRGARIRGSGLKYFEKNLRARGWPVKRLSPIAELRMNIRAGIDWLVGPKSLRIR